MTLNEFKAWLDGFSAAMGEAPTPEQWAAIKKKLQTVQPLPVPAPTYLPNQWPGRVDQRFGQLQVTGHANLEKSQ